MNNELICTPVAVKKDKFTVVCHDLWQDDNGKYFLYSTDEGDRMPDSAIELYLVSDEEIKEGDIIILNCSNIVEKVGKEGRYSHGNARKVVSATDKSLSLPLIPDSFIEEWVAKQGKIDKIRVQINSDYMSRAENWKNEIPGEVIILPIEGSGAFTWSEMKEVAKRAFGEGYNARIAEEKGAGINPEAVSDLRDALQSILLGVTLHPQLRETAEAAIEKAKL